MNETANGWVWFGFSLFVVIALCIDSFFHHKKTTGPHRPIRASLCWTLVWVSCALIFNLLLWIYLHYTHDAEFANRKALEFFTGYLIEKSLSVDNLFVFYLVFHQLHISDRHQRRVFAYGIWGAIIMRLGIILVGVWLISKFHWLLYVMGAFLVLTGIKMCVARNNKKDLADTLIMKLANKMFRVTDVIEDEHFFVLRKGLWYATPLFLAVFFIEISDLIFAFDSIPAILVITTDPFIVWTSNIFAILGLRALYFLLASMIERLHLLKYGIALILVFVGVKMLVEHWIDIPIGISLAIILFILTLFSWLSFSRVPK